jgi:hypothetical protein
MPVLADQDDIAFVQKGNNARGARVSNEFDPGRDAVLQADGIFDQVHDPSLVNQLAVEIGFIQRNSCALK